MDLQDPPISADVQVETSRKRGRPKLKVRGPLQKPSEFQIPGSISQEVPGALNVLNFVADYDNNLGDLLDSLRPSQFLQDNSQSSQGEGSSFHKAIDQIIGPPHHVDDVHGSGSNSTTITDI